MRVVEPVEQQLEEVGRVSQVLHVDRHHLEPVLGMVAQVVHDAGLAGTPGRREHDVPGAQGLPPLRHERAAESQVDRIDRCAGVELGGGPSFHVVLVVNQICRINYCTTILLYVNCVVENRQACLPRRSIPPVDLETSGGSTPGQRDGPVREDLTVRALRRRSRPPAGARSSNQVDGAVAMLETSVTGSTLTRLVEPVPIGAGIDDPHVFQGQVTQPPRGCSSSSSAHPGT